MASIQLALDNTNMADLLKGLLVRSTEMPVRCVESPDLCDEGVMVVDPAHLSRLDEPLPHPERVVLIASKDSVCLDNAWKAGVNSVVSDRDPISTMVLAILSACLRSDSWPPPPPKRRP
jgi:hypothetical protein